MSSQLPLLLSMQLACSTNLLVSLTIQSLKTSSEVCYGGGRANKTKQKNNGDPQVHGPRLHLLRVVHREHQSGCLVLFLW